MGREQFAAIAAIGIVALLFAALILFGLWMRGGAAATGRIVRFGLRETDMGSFPVAVVRAGDRFTTVKLPRANTCRVGDEITFRLRSRSVVDYNPCGRPPTE